MRPHIHGYNNEATESQNSGSSPLGQNLAEGGSTATILREMYAEAPASNSILEPPAGVIVVNGRGGDISFNFTTTGSVGDDMGLIGANSGSSGEWINFGGNPASGSVISISPTAWSGSGAGTTTGDVVFIYNRFKK